MPSRFRSTLRHSLEWTSPPGEPTQETSTCSRRYRLVTAAGRARFEELVARSERVEVGGVVVMVAGLDDIIASKERADRPKDREALVELRELRDR